MMVLLDTTMRDTARNGPAGGSHDPADPGREGQRQYWNEMSEIPMKGSPSTVPSWR